jgi:mRNA-degrading endonuclease RelE of RelBE toxin-antitoxin system
MAEIDSVELVERWVFADLSSSAFSEEEKREALDDLDELEEQLVTWGRPLTKAVSILTTSGDHTVYRRRQGDLRAYLIRDGSTLYCIGIGKRKTTYERDLSTIQERAREHQSDRE